MRHITPRSLFTLVVLLLLVACDGSSPTAATLDESTVTTVSTTASTPFTNDMYGLFYGASVSQQGDRVVIVTDDLPDHPSPYYSPGNPLYEAPDTGMVVNPNIIVAQNLTLRIPADPQIASSPTETGLGPIGVAVNGVALFNQYAGRSAFGFRPLGDEIATFDRFNGHPQGDGQYHYHIEPVWLTSRDSSALVGVLLDGFPVYGPRDADGSVPGDLDVCNGHVGRTEEFPDGIYHYHVTATDPYISGCYRGTPGTRSG